MMEHAGRTPSRYFLRAARPPCFPRRAVARDEVDSRIACMFYKGLVCAAYSKRGPAFICLVLSCSQAFGKIRECFATPQWLFRSLTRCCLSLHVNLLEPRTVCIPALRFTGHTSQCKVQHPSRGPQRGLGQHLCPSTFLISLSLYLNIKYKLKLIKTSD